MPRKKRGGGKGGSVAGSRKTRSSKLLESIVVSEESTGQSPTESEESCSSGTPKSCNTPVEIEKSVSTLIQHKKFGKIRCLVDDAQKTEASSSESEIQNDPVEQLDTKIIQTDPIETEAIIENIPLELEPQTFIVNAEEMIQDELIQEEIAEDITEIGINCNEIIQTDNVYDNVIETEIELSNLQISDTSQEPVQLEELPEVILPETLTTEPEKSLEENFEKFVIFESKFILEGIKNKITESLDKDAKRDSKTDKSTTVRRSSRIKSISVLKQRSRGHGLVKSEKKDKTYKPKIINTDIDVLSDNSNSNNTIISEKHPLDSPSFITPTIGLDNEQKPVKVKSRWRRSSELEMGGSSPITVTPYPLASPQTIPESPEIQSTCLQPQKEESPVYDEEMEHRLRQFHTLSENQYLTERTSCKEAKKMVCDCFLTKEEIERGEFGCGEDCLNRLLMIECGNQCVVGDRCTNKRFQKNQYASCEVFRTDKKGFGMRATANIQNGDFILEYVGEVLDPDEFDKRATEYSKEKNRHYYFMALRADAVIDATQKGNISRFINHSCDPNAETQKWTVNGELRIGFFSKRSIVTGEEITFDYQFQRYGKEAQKCYCEASTCRGWIGEEPQDDDDDDESEDSEREDIEEEDVKESDNVETGVKKPKVFIKREIKKRKYNKKQLKDIFEDADLDEEIGMLSTTGVKNRAHTVKLTRLMVRAEDVATRMQLLKLLREGDLPCRRLFLDYQGLRLIYGWMCDVALMTDLENTNYAFRIEILETLVSLPIPNKTMLQDSKVLNMVDKWSNNKTELNLSPLDSESNSPQIDSVFTPIAETIKEEIKPVEQESMEIDPVKEETKIIDISDVKQDEENIEIKTEIIETVELTQTDDTVEVISENVEVKDPAPVEIKDVVAEVKSEKEKLDEIERLKQLGLEKEKFIHNLIGKLLSDWSGLKEVFRIPKKERYEQMKEHEREADRDYKEETLNKNEPYSWKNERYRLLEKERKKAKAMLEYERNLAKKGLRLDDRNLINMPRLSKYERRQLFALQVQQEEEGRRRKHEQDMWRAHEQRCIIMGVDPRMTSMEQSSTSYANFCQWQNFGNSPVPQPQAPPSLFDINIMPQLPPRPNLPQQMPQLMPPLAGSPIPNRTSLLPLPYQPPQVVKEEIIFAGPIPPPVKLPPKWKTANDQYGRPYYYHIKTRIPQWEPPEFPTPLVEPPTELMEETSSSTDTSSASSDSASDSDEDNEINDTRLLIQIRSKLKKKENTANASISSPIPCSSQEVKTESPLAEVVEQPNRLIDLSAQKRKRDGLVQEIIISPRSEEDKIAHKAEVRKYKENKEKLRRQKQMLLEKSKKKLKGKLGLSSTSRGSRKHRVSKQAKHKTVNNSLIDLNTEEAKKIKEIFRSSMASVMVQNLNSYRKPDCKMGRITNTEDFKHLARKLTHFVMMKELKHCQNIQDLTCNESVKAKAREFVKKYMTKFGDVYSRPKDEMD